MAKMVETVLWRSWGFTFVVWGFLVYAGRMLGGTEGTVLAASILPIAGIIAAMTPAFLSTVRNKDKKVVMDTFLDTFSEMWQFLIILGIYFVLDLITYNLIDARLLKGYSAVCVVLTFWAGYAEHGRLSLLKTFIFSFVLSPIIVYIFISIYKKDKAEKKETYFANLEKINEYMERGYDFNKQEDYVNAIAEYTKAIELGSEDSSSQRMHYTIRAHAYREQGDYANAIADYTKAIGLDPNDETPYEGRAEAYLKQKDYAKAIADCTKVIELEPEEYKYRYYAKRAKVYLEQGDYANAIADYTKAIELNPEDGWNYRDRADVYLEHKDYENAVADYTKAIEIDPENMKLLDYVGRAKVYLAQKDYANAIADCTKAIEIDPNNPYCYGERAKVYLEQEDYVKAIADYTKAIEINPNISYYYKKRGEAHQKLGNTEQAEADFAKAKELEKKQENE